MRWTGRPVTRPWLVKSSRGLSPHERLILEAVPLEIQKDPEEIGYQLDAGTELKSKTIALFGPE